MNWILFGLLTSIIIGLCGYVTLVAALYEADMIITGGCIILFGLLVILTTTTIDLIRVKKED